MTDKLCDAHREVVHDWIKKNGIYNPTMMRALTELMNEIDVSRKIIEAANDLSVKAQTYLYTDTMGTHSKLFDAIEKFEESKGMDTVKCIPVEEKI